MPVRVTLPVLVTVKV
jgi:hypothetical protein